MTAVFALIAATSILVLIPGPNVALIVANSVKFGFRMGVVTVMGTTLGVALQLALVVLGLAAIIELAADAMTWIRWAGVAYLVWLGIRTWREPASDLGQIQAVPAMFWRGCMLAVLNPKTLLFNAAFLPQFVADPSVVQLALMSIVFLTVLFLGDLAWAYFAGVAQQRIRGFSKWRNKVSGAFLVAAGAGLAFARRT